MMELVLLSLALAVDAATVCAAVGASGAGPRELGRAALVFGSFQGGMALVGATLGSASESVLGPVLPWAAGTILVLLGGFVLFAGDDDDDVTVASWPAVLGLGLATSLDAMAAGVALPLWSTPVAVSVTVIGVVTAVASGLAGWLGAGVAERLGSWAERGAGLVLLLLGLRVLWMAW